MHYVSHLNFVDGHLEGRPLNNSPPRGQINAHPKGRRGIISLARRHIIVFVKNSNATLSILVLLCIRRMTRGFSSCFAISIVSFTNWDTMPAVAIFGFLGLFHWFRGFLERGFALTVAFLALGAIDVKWFCPCGSLPRPWSHRWFRRRRR